MIADCGAYLPVVPMSDPEATPGDRRAASYEIKALKLRTLQRRLRLRAVAAYREWSEKAGRFGPVDAIDD